MVFTVVMNTLNDKVCLFRGIQLQTMRPLLYGALTLFLLFGDGMMASGQAPNVIDSLHRRLSVAREDTNKVKVLFKLCWEHMQNRGSLDSSKYYSDLGLRLCQKLNYEKGIAQIHYYKGLMDRLEGNYFSGLEHFQTFADYHIIRGDSLKLANALYQMGVIYNYQGNYEKSLRMYLRILSIYADAGDVFMEATTLNSIGIIFKDMGSYPEAIAKYNAAHAIFDSLSSKIDMADCLHNLGNVYALQKKYKDALKFYERSLQLDEELNNEWGIAYQLESIGTVYLEMGQYTQALAYQIRSLEIRERLKQKKELAGSLNKMGMIYSKLGHGDKAIDHFQRSLSIANDLGIKPEIGNAYAGLSEAFHSLRDYKNAYEYRVRFGEIRDSLFHEDMMKQISDLRTRYETEKKEAQIVMLNKEKQLQTAEILRQRTVKNSFITSSVLLLLFVAALFFNYRQKLKSGEIIARKNDEINRQKIVELENNQKLYALDAMITGQDAERKRIAQDLHDGLGALLSTVRMHFSSIEAEINKLHELDVYNAANRLLDEACQEVRKIAHNMMPGTLVRLGLVPALEDMCDKINGTDQLKVEFHAFDIDDDRRLGESVEITLYRLVQESLNNIVRHAGARHAIVQLSKDEDQIYLTIEDDGNGFVVKDALEKQGMGMRNLDSRVKYLNGKFDIQSELGKGTSISIEIPVQKDGRHKSTTIL